MTDPERLLASTYEGDELERQLLGSIRNVLPPPEAKNRTWEGIAVQVATVAVVGAGGFAAQSALGATSAAAAEAASVGGTTAVAGGLPASAAVVGVAAKAFTAKAVAGVVAASLTVGAGGWWATKQITSKQAVSAVHHRATVEATPTVPPAWSPTATVAPCDPAYPTAPCPPVAGAAAADAPSRAADEPRQRNQLALESRMLTEARAQLRSGDPRGAMATLDKLQSRSPRGILAQEREVLTIQVLAALGDTAGAGRRAKAFLDTYPNSPHAPQLRRFAGEP